MTTSRAPQAEVSVDFRVRAYSAAGRAVAAALLAVAGASLPAILFLVAFVPDAGVTPPVLADLVASYTLLPAIGAWLVRRLSATVLEVHERELVLRRRGERIEIPAEALARIVPWNLPLPEPGLSLRLRSGRRFRYGIAADDPGAAVWTLAGLGGVEAAHAAAEHPTFVYAHARAGGAPRRRWYHWLGKFPLFALAPTLVLFRAHQYIAHGGPFGEYYLLGLGSYLRTFSVYWGTMTAYLVLYAGAWRGLAELVALAAARVVPPRAAGVRRGVEAACRWVYYAGVPVLLAIRFLPW
jgi:hypothetical protein